MMRLSNRLPLAAVASDVRCLARTHGLRTALGAVARGVTDSYATDELQVLVKPLDEIVPMAIPSRLRVEDLGPGSLPALAQLNRARCDTRADRRFARNLERRYHGFIAHEDGTPAGYYWWLDEDAQGHDHLEQLGIRLGRTDAYGFDFFLAEAHRGEGRAGEFLHHVETRLRDRGYERLWGYVSERNTPARWLYSTRGYSVERTVRRRPGAMR
jgi:GNAT superfamily N-acetyltransferase